MLRPFGESPLFGLVFLVFRLGLDLNTQRWRALQLTSHPIRACGIVMARGTITAVHTHTDLCHLVKAGPQAPRCKAALVPFPRSICNK